MKMFYKEDVILALETYISSCISKQIGIEKVAFAKHYCKKYGFPKNRYQTKVESIYSHYMEGNK